MENPDL